MNTGSTLHWPGHGMGGWIVIVDTRAATHSQAETAKFGRDLRVTLLKPMY